MTAPTRLGLIASILGLYLIAGCRGNPDASGDWRGERTASGDTTFVHTQSGSLLGDLGTIPRESLEVVYAGEGVLQSTVVATAGNRLLIGEGTQIVVVESSGGIDTLGREGDGPGEFRRIIGLRNSGDTIEAIDQNANRFTRFTPTGAPTVVTLDAPAEYAALRAAPLSKCKGAMLETWTSGFARRGGPPDSVATAWWTAGSPPTPWLVVESISWTASGNMFAPRSPFGIRVLIASDGGCRVAFGDAASYVVRLHDAATGAVTIVSAKEADVPVTAEMQTIPERWQGEFEASLLPAMLDLMGAQEYGAVRSKVEVLQMDTQGRVWVQVVDSTYQYHPWVLSRVMEARPHIYRWDVFGTDGKRLAVVHLPSNFTPKAWGGQWVYGIAEDEDGALVVGRLPVPEALQ